MSSVEKHPLEPFLPEGTTLLMLGSFPPAQKRWSMDFFYPNFINDMWRIFGIVFKNDKNHFVDNNAKTFKRTDIIRLLEEKGIGLYDTAQAVNRTKNTASDKDLEVVEETDIEALLHKVPGCKAVATTGQKATDLFAMRFKITPPGIGESVAFEFESRQMQLFRMPSSSRAYPMKLEKKAELYKHMFECLGMAKH